MERSLISSVSRERLRATAFKYRRHLWSPILVDLDVFIQNDLYPNYGWVLDLPDIDFDPEAEAEVHQLRPRR